MLAGPISIQIAIEICRKGEEMAFDHLYEMYIYK